MKKNSINLKLPHGVKLSPDVATALTSNMYEGFKPTKKNIKLAELYLSKKITKKELLERL
ncbi:MAG: antitoxin VbhA family protein [Rickettsiales bacterium]|jgi:hypothetical protein|nr:antitoxin VbhA family protein [Rickettsiales bacterium]